MITIGFSTRKIDSSFVELLKKSCGVSNPQIIPIENEGKYSLPEDIRDDMVYTFPQLQTEFSVELNLEVSDDVDTIEVDSDYYSDEDTISITIISNPNLDREILEELHYELNEIVRHELEHINQYERGDNIPKKKPKKPLKYYSQKHELEAQIAGFIRRAKKERKPLEVVIRNWFDKNQSKRKLSSNDVEIIIKKLLELV